MKLKNKVAIITGSGQGLGLSYAKALAKEGCKIVIAEYNEETGRNVSKELNSQGYDTTFIKCDVSVEKDIINTVNKTIEKYNTINILINNAQTTVKPYHTIDKTTTEEMEVAFKTGPLATQLFMRECIPYMIKANYGRIINVCSDTGIDGMKTFAAYGSAKEAIRCLTRVAARELGEYQITCNVISPGALTAAAKTWMENDPEGFKKTMEPVPLKRLGNADTDIAPAVVFLSSPEGNYITGQTIFLDGGHTFGR